MTDLPDGWMRAEISELVETQLNGKPFQQGWSPQCESRPAIEGEWGVLKTTAIQHGKFWSQENKALPENLTPRPQIEIKPGDVLMTCAGPRNRCGVACIVGTTRPMLMMSGKMYRFRPHPEMLDPRFLSFFIRLSDTQVRIDAMKTGINDSGLNLTHSRFGKLPVVVPPLDEQHRIVEQVEALFEEIDRGIESLQAAKNNIELYRQSLLKSAFEGRLTTDWRAQNPDRLESPEALLARIREERERRYRDALDDWDQAVASWRTDGAKGRRPAKPHQAPNLLPAGPDEMEALPQLPQGWIYTKLANLGDLGRGKSKHRPRNDKRLFGGPYPFIQTAEVKAAGRSITKYRVTYSEFGLAQSKIWPEGTLCITIAANIAETAFLTFDACFPDSVVGFTAFDDIIEPKFAELFVKSTRANIESSAPATAQKNINLGTLEALIVPLSGLAEQAEVVRILDTQLEAVGMLSSEIDAARGRADALRQSILKKAFAGQLVPQDPDDEPAAALLARLQAERTKAPARRRRQRVEI